jgi:hypothetical protein
LISVCENARATFIGGGELIVGRVPRDSAYSPPVCIIIANRQGQIAL